MLKRPTRVNNYFALMSHRSKIQYICISFCVHVFRVGAVSNTSYWRFSFRPVRKGLKKFMTGIFRRQLKNICIQNRLHQPFSEMKTADAVSPEKVSVFQEHMFHN